MTHLYFIRHAQQFSAHHDGGPMLADHEAGLPLDPNLAELRLNGIIPICRFVVPGALRRRRTGRARRLCEAQDTAWWDWHWLELKDIHVQGWELLAANDTHHLDDC